MHTKVIHNQLKLRSRLLAGLLLAGVALLFAGGTALADTQSYKTKDATITKGMAVAVVSETGQGQTPYVQKASAGNADKTLGVVTSLDSSLVTNVANGTQLVVANSGVAAVYVTDINGLVHKGDLLAPSPLEGILMRADNGTPGILGVALDNFADLKTETVKVDSPSISQAKVGLMGINMDVKFATSSSGVQQSFLERLGQSIVHRQVNSLQAFVALAVLVLLIVVEGGIIYAAVSSSILSLGRNPLGKKTIIRGLWQTSLLVLVVLAAGLAAIYMVLRI